jgi:hypothetical protein
MKLNAKEKHTNKPQLPHAQSRQYYKRKKFSQKEIKLI